MNTNFLTNVDIDGPSTVVVDDTVTYAVRMTAEKLLPGLPFILCAKNTFCLQNIDGAIVQNVRVQNEMGIAVTPGGQFPVQLDVQVEIDNNAPITIVVSAKSANSTFANLVLVKFDLLLDVTFSCNVDSREFQLHALAQIFSCLECTPPCQIDSTTDQKLVTLESNSCPTPLSICCPPPIFVSVEEFCDPDDVPIGKPPVVDGCVPQLSHENVVVSRYKFLCGHKPRVANRVWTVTDICNQTATCTQKIYFYFLSNPQLKNKKLALCHQ